MATVIDLKQFQDERGSLTVIQEQIPYDIKRVFYIYGVQAGASRGGHGHYRTKISLVCIHGSCLLKINNQGQKSEHLLDSPTKCVLLEPDDWHIMEQFTEGAVLLALASEPYDKEDYFYEEPK